MLCQKKPTKLLLRVKKNIILQSVKSHFYSFFFFHLEHIISIYSTFLVEIFFNFATHSVTTHHVHEGGSHLVHPHVGTGATEPVDDDFGGCGHVERFAGPVPDGRHVRERHVQQWRVATAPARVVQQKPRVYLKKNKKMYFFSSDSELSS